MYYSMNCVVYIHITFSILAFGRCGDLSTAFTLVDEMAEKKVAISDETFNFLLQACITDKEAGFRHALLV
jgi:pentatricopeptide repeat domain-containing protein 1